MSSLEVSASRPHHASTLPIEKVCQDCELPLCTAKRGAPCHALEARVVEHPQTPLDPADLAAIRSLWGKLLLAIADADEAAVSRVLSDCDDSSYPRVTAAQLARSGAASSWDGLGLRLSPGSGDQLTAHVGPPLPAMSTYVFRRVGGLWRLCAVLSGA